MARCSEAVTERKDTWAKTYHSRSLFLCHRSASMGVGSHGRGLDLGPGAPSRYLKSVEVGFEGVQPLKLLDTTTAIRMKVERKPPVAYTYFLLKLRELGQLFFTCFGKVDCEKVLASDTHGDEKLNVHSHCRCLLDAINGAPAAPKRCT